MGVTYKLKQLAEFLPYSVGRWASFIPYSLRLGWQYHKFYRKVFLFEKSHQNEKYSYIVRHLNMIVQHAQKNIPFYTNLYGSAPIQIKNLIDFEKLPVITKSHVRDYAKQTTGAMLLNSGGTSGEPLSFYIDKYAWAREWAHMHYIWGLRGYRPTSLMITILGKNLGKYFYKYNAVHNEIRINPYMDARNHITEIMRIIKDYPILYIQGYPSSIYNLLREIESHLGEKAKSILRSKIKCCLFSSEYPITYMVKYIHEVWNLDFLSWYGHSEMCILAHDNKKEGYYFPLFTYGYAEENQGVLCGTSYHNYDMPLIRYSTGDLVEGKKNNDGFLSSFVIKEGREGDFIEDRFGKKIPLTSVIFGRHHKIFNIADYVQIYQKIKGAATFIVTIKRNLSFSENRLASFFDISGLNISFKFKIVDKPFLTIRGKLKLKLTNEDIRLYELIKEHE